MLKIIYFINCFFLVVLLDSLILVKDYDYFAIKWFNYESLVGNGWDGFASFYIQETWNEKKLVNEGKPEVYLELMKIDAEFGTKDERQLWECCLLSADLNLIKVNI